jgi:hypothetical protein
MFLAAALATPCVPGFAQQTSAPAGSESSGTTIATAVVLNETDDGAAIKAEDAWLAQRYPGYTKIGQALLNQHSHFYDAIDITTASHETKKVYFDITKSQDALTNMFLKSN